jgi:hypothetical protein
MKIAQEKQRSIEAAARNAAPPAEKTSGAV